jgi:hypothetical protein
MQAREEDAMRFIEAAAMDAAIVEGYERVPASDRDPLGVRGSARGNQG